MKKYIRCHLVEAMPMTRGEYNKHRGWEIPANENPADEGYHVVCPDGCVIFRLTATPLGNENFHKGGFWEYPDQTV